MGTLGRAIFTVGKWIRGTGQAMDRLGSTIQGGLRVEEQRKHPTPSVRSVYLPIPHSAAGSLLQPAVVSYQGWDRVFINHFDAARS
ncbi:uncharacterized protein C2845_PM04G29510 [Panicum miliaceum]|jgi:hypothetical protein|uniref:Uncharacterized protein n=1 Tax=Panicum miliaceum TaxID=4540 RepID=A0A3L6QRD7_PANMI|nr:uncharacterized protein C2845_PM04G29510 [Panicum miliaceum]